MRNLAAVGNQVRRYCVPVSTDEPRTLLKGSLMNCVTHMNATLFYGILSLAIAVGGCTQPEETAVNGPAKSILPAWKVPMVGTFYIYHVTNVGPNSTQNLLDTITVIANGLAILGKTNVFETLS